MTQLVLGGTNVETIPVPSSNLPTTQNERISSFDCGLFFRVESSWAEEKKADCSE